MSSSGSPISVLSFPACLHSEGEGEGEGEGVGAGGGEGAMAKTQKQEFCSGCTLGERLGLIRARARPSRRVFWSVDRIRHVFLSL